MAHRNRTASAVMIGVMLAAAACGGDTGSDNVAGVDSDGDGVRDDVAEHVPTFDVELRGYLHAVATNEQKVVAFDGDAAAAYEIAVEANRLVTCIPTDLDHATARDAGAAVREQVADTDARQANLREFTAAISGWTFLEPDCDTEPEGDIVDPDASDP